ncbi:MAG: HDOD domain-containing protein [Myxococcota bacterium]
MNDLERKLLGSPSLPTLPVVAQRILELLQDSDVDLSRVASVLSCDSSLTARVLRMINSPLYGLARPVVSLREAVLYLGINAVRSVALSFSFISTFPPGSEGQALEDLWRTSLMNALAARRLAGEVGGWDAEEAFLAGLIADCGAMLLLKQLPEYGALVQRFCQGEADLLDLERASVDTDHMRVASLLLEHWNFPEPLRLVLATHHDPSPLPPGSSEELQARILTGAWLCARTLSVPGFSGEAASLPQHLSILLGLSIAPARAIISELPDELREVAGFFQIPVAQQRSWHELLGEANEELSRLAIDAERSAEDTAAAAEAELADLSDLRTQLTDRLAHDPNAPLLSRPSFERVLEAYHGQARRSRHSLGLMLIELEDLKSIEARFGPAAVDGAMAQAAERVLRQMRSGDWLGRFGVAQIAVLVSRCPSGALRRAAERVRQSLEQSPLELAEGSFRCSATIGLASSDPHRDGLDPRALSALVASALDRARASSEAIVSASD